MATEQIVRVGDVGTRLELEVNENSIIVDIAGATTLNITIKRPDGTTVVKPGVLSSDGSDGKAFFATESGDISIEGSYYIQIYVVLPTWTGSSSIEEFIVQGNL